MSMNCLQKCRWTVFKSVGELSSKTVSVNCLVPHQKKCFYKLLGSFWKIEFLTENRQPRPLQKWWKFCTISKWAKNFFSGKILCSTHQKKWFYKLLGSFWKFEFLTENRQPRTLQKWWKFCTISKWAKKIFFGKILCSTHQKKWFYKLLGSFWKFEFLTENRQPQTLQKWWKFCTISKCAKKIFFGKILCSTHQKKCFYKLLGSFWKIFESTAADLTDGKSTAADLTKMVKILYYLKMC